MLISTFYLAKRSNFVEFIFSRVPLQVARRGRISRACVCLRGELNFAEGRGIEVI